MSWLNNLGSNLQQDPADGSGRFSTPYNRLTGLTEGPVAVQEWPSSQDFPLAPTAPGRENLSCNPPKEPEPISYVTLQEQRCVLSWFQGWNTAQRERFMQDLLGKAVPGKVCTLLDSLSTLQVNDDLPNIFECQLRLWTQWFVSWEEEERNHFLHILEEKDPAFVALFYRGVAGTAGKD